MIIRIPIPDGLVKVEDGKNGIHLGIEEGENSTVAKLTPEKAEAVGQSLVRAARRNG